MNYMIHAAPPRMWYVEEFLIPALLAQGIRREEILVALDDSGRISRTKLSTGVWNPYQRLHGKRLD